MKQLSQELNGLKKPRVYARGKCMNVQEGRVASYVKGEDSGTGITVEYRDSWQKLVMQ